ncbi:hypothetical protein EG028_08195 [Chitinophaga barathri]|uniref:Uncharacterized protein n=1 Tax=Chitinophaga barathri TaxID=1647451 RepID=A0A3N4MFD7_9BACT|nr:hypothetical protein EG028_08195 [Chitinophaga barathri]
MVWRQDIYCVSGKLPDLLFLYDKIRYPGYNQPRKKDKDKCLVFNVFYSCTRSTSPVMTPSTLLR